MSKSKTLADSIRIVSKAKGWDPDAIVGEAYQSHPITESDTAGGIPSSMTSAQQEQAAREGVDWNMPDVSREKPKRTTNANPYPGMPGSE